MRGIVRLLGRLGASLALLTGAAGTAAAQVSCSVNWAANCVIGNSATIALNVTVTRAIRLSLGSSTLALDVPSAMDFDAGFGQTAAPTFEVKSNSAYSISLRTTQATWTASPAPARANKPSSELQWAVAVGGPFTNVSTTATTIATGAATASQVIPLQFRVRYNWLLDTPGTYSLPLQLTITSP